MPLQLSFFTPESFTNVEWDKSVHLRENVSESQKQLDKNRKKFGGQNKTVLEYLHTGEFLTVRKAMNQLNITSLPRRVKDLTSAGFKISWSWNDGDEKYKIWFCTEADRKYNNELMK